MALMTSSTVALLLISAMSLQFFTCPARSSMLLWGLLCTFVNCCLSREIMPFCFLISTSNEPIFLVIRKWSFLYWAISFVCCLICLLRSLVCRIRSVFRVFNLATVEASDPLGLFRAFCWDVAAELASDSVPDSDGDCDTDLRLDFLVLALVDVSVLLAPAKLMTFLLGLLLRRSGVFAVGLSELETSRSPFRISL